MGSLEGEAESRLVKDDDNQYKYLLGAEEAELRQWRIVANHGNILLLRNKRLINLTDVHLYSSYIVTDRTCSTYCRLWNTPSSIDFRDICSLFGGIAFCDDFWGGLNELQLKLSRREIQCPLVFLDETASLLLLRALWNLHPGKPHEARWFLVDITKSEVYSPR